MSVEIDLLGHTCWRSVLELHADCNFIEFLNRRVQASSFTGHWNRAEISRYWIWCRCMLHCKKFLAIDFRTINVGRHEYIYLFSYHFWENRLSCAHKTRVWCVYWREEISISFGYTLTAYNLLSLIHCSDQWPVQWIKPRKYRLNFAFELIFANWTNDWMSQTNETKSRLKICLLCSTAFLWSTTYCNISNSTPLIHMIFWSIRCRRHIWYGC